MRLWGTNPLYACGFYFDSSIGESAWPITRMFIDHRRGTRRAFQASLGDAGVVVRLLPRRLAGYFQRFLRDLTIFGERDACNFIVGACSLPHPWVSDLVHYVFSTKQRQLISDRSTTRVIYGSDCPEEWFQSSDRRPNRRPRPPPLVPACCHSPGQSGATGERAHRPAR
jgi:hypothetical protein